MSNPGASSKITGFLGKYKILIAFLVLIIVISFMTPNFLSWRNIINVFRQSSIIGIMAIGATFVIIGGGFDISVGSLLALTAAMVVGLQSYMHWFPAMLVVLLVGAAFGVANGFLTSKIHIPPIIATLGTMTIIRGIVYMYTGGYPLYVDSEGFAFIGNGYVGPVPFPIILLLALVALGQFILVRTKFGRYSCAIGGNKEAARLSGVKVDFYIIMTFVMGGVMAAMSGIVYASRLLSVTPLAGQGYELDAIASAVIGGTSVSGGEGSVLRTLIGALLLTMITNAFNLIGIDLYVQYVFKGLVILAAVGFDSFYKARS
ncbi:MAG TPA: ABC transporter permease [Mesotoga sp.]|jgi:ribose transport system permease protein|nr:ABC transporter permease [Mesotoga sp.]NLX32871.1 ABC transporter permease [Thermotogaceae bacterium]MDD4040831.1 ABC transporter permease [Mesotoga sp.]MDD4479163.1 ABC transporter permease [Mesotoga sp.]MDD5744643.1 ABC transporter permease [Mesotoga sp.]